VRIKRREGQVFVFCPQKRTGLTLDVDVVQLKLTREDILERIAKGANPANPYRC
jgi:hypothetical protein